MDIPLETIDRLVADTVTFYPYADIIGDDLKRREGDVETGNVTYVIRKDRSYIIRLKDAQNPYKLDFTGIYNATGRKGYPAFKFQKIIRG